LKECADEIKDKLFAYAWPHIRRALGADFPNYYKELLLKRSFENEGPEQAPEENLIVDDGRSNHSPNVTPTCNMVEE
jgi:hypothetical protein